MDRWVNQAAVAAHVSEDSIRVGLRDAKLVLLQIITAQLTAEEKWLKADRQAVETKLLELLLQLRASQAPAAAPDSSPLFQQLVRHAGLEMQDEALKTVRRPMSQSAREFLLDEMYGYPSSAAQSPLQGAGSFHVVICGIGVCGLAVAIRLKKAGVPFTVLESSEGIGGTWNHNVYPNVGCDTPSHVYSFSSDPNADWTRYFAKGHENKEYLNRLADKYEVTKHVLFGHSVDSATFDSSSGCWSVAFRRKDGSKGLMAANVYVSAVGMLSMPKIPHVAGREDFEGKQCHTARWDGEVSFVGKHVAIVGSGASCMQVAPTLAAVASHVTIFQGTPQWCSRIPNYKWEIPEGERWCFANLPFYERWYRFQLLAHFTDIYEEMMTAESAENTSLWQSLKAYYEDQLAEHPDLLKKALPDYPPACTRLLVDNGWFELLKRKNVTLINSHVSRVQSKSVVAENPGEVAADVDFIVWATGFRSTEFCLAAMKIFGRDGLALQDFWGREPSAYLGVSVPRFPNFFMTYGPNSNVAAGGSIVWVAENQARYIEQCCTTMIQNGLRSMEVREEVFQTYNAELDEAQRTRAWADSRCTSWYKEGNTGKVTTGSPWSLEEYCRRLRQLSLEDFRVVSTS